MASQGLPWHVVPDGCSNKLPAAGTQLGKGKTSGPDWLAADPGVTSPMGSSSPREPENLAGLAYILLGVWKGGRT